MKTNEISKLEKVLKEGRKQLLDFTLSANRADEVYRNCLKVQQKLEKLRAERLEELKAKTVAAKTKAFNEWMKKDLRKHA